MKQIFKISLAICISTTLLTGCQSGLIKNRDFGRLAFWKNESLRLASKSDDIPPPSRHFSPDPGEGSATRDELKSNVDQILAQSKKSQTQGSESKSSDPIRKPYSLDALASKEGSGSKSNDFVLNKKLDKIQSAANNAFQATEKAVGNASKVINNATEIAKTTSNGFQGTGGAFTGWQNNLKNSAESQIQNATDQFKGQVNRTVGAATNSINHLKSNSVAALNNSLGTVKNSLDNAFQPPNNANAFTGKASAVSSKNNVAAKGTSGTLSPIDSPVAKTDFVSQYKNATKQFASKNPSEKIGSVQQSSFDSASDSPSSKLMPVASDIPSKYPSTSYGQFKPVDRSERESLQIPPQLLRGKSSFSPGSTKPLRPVEPGK